MIQEVAQTATDANGSGFPVVELITAVVSVLVGWFGKKFHISIGGSK